MPDAHPAAAPPKIHEMRRIYLQLNDQFRGLFPKRKITQGQHYSIQRSGARFEATLTDEFREEVRRRPRGMAQESEPYRCKRCGDSGRILTNDNRPSCPSCGRRMERTDRGDRDE